MRTLKEQCIWLHRFETLDQAASSSPNACGGRLIKHAASRKPGALHAEQMRLAILFDIDGGGAIA